MHSVPDFVAEGQPLSEAQAVVRVPEPLTLINVPAVVSAVEEALTWTPWLVLDMVDVRHVDSVGADVLLWACNQARRRCGDAYLVAVSEAVRAAPDWSRLSAIASQPRPERMPAPVPWQRTGPEAVPASGE
jgi:anti-anti-sigma factor